MSAGRPRPAQGVVCIAERTSTPLSQDAAARLAATCYKRTALPTLFRKWPHPSQQPLELTASYAPQCLRRDYTEKRKVDVTQRCYLDGDSAEEVLQYIPPPPIQNKGTRALCVCVL